MARNFEGIGAAVSWTEVGWAVGLWLAGGFVLAFTAPTGASFLALFLTLLGTLYARDPQRRRLAFAFSVLPLGERRAPQPHPMPTEARHFMEREFAAAKRGRDLAVVLFGFPDYVEFARRAGMDAADKSMVEFGRVLERMTRRMNLSARYGWRAGTFLSVLSDADAAAAHRFVARVKDATAELQIPMPQLEVGLAVYQPHMTSPEELVHEAERAYAATLAGVC